MLNKVYPSDRTPVTETEYTFDPVAWHNGVGVAFPAAGRVYMWLATDPVNTWDKVGYSLMPGLVQGNQYQLSFEYFNPYEPVARPSVYLRVWLGDQVVWQYGIGEGAPTGWVRQVVGIEPQADNERMELSVSVEEFPDQWGWTGMGTMFRHIRVRTLPEIVKESVQPGDTVIMAAQDASVSALVKERGARVMPWPVVAGVPVTEALHTLADAYCRTVGEARLDDEGDTYLLRRGEGFDPVASPVDVLFDVVPMIDAGEVQMGRLSPRDFTKWYCELERLGQEAPVLVLLDSEAAPPGGPLRLGDVTWASAGEEFEVLVDEITRVTGQGGTILLDSSVEPVLGWDPGSSHSLIEMFRDGALPVGSGALTKIYPSDWTPVTETEYTFDPLAWHNGVGVAFPAAGRLYMYLTTDPVNTWDKVGYSLMPGLVQGNQYQLSFEYFNPYEPVARPSVYLRVWLGDQVVWQYGLGEGAPLGWVKQTVEIESERDNERLRFSMEVRDSPDQWEWGKYSMTGFRHIHVESMSRWGR